MENWSCTKTATENINISNFPFIRMNKNWMDIARRIQSIAQSGMTYCENEFDLERYRELKEIAKSIISEHTNTDFDRVAGFLDMETGYLTPKVDIRVVVFQDEKILMVKEKIDGKWSLPGGWADVGLSPFEIAEKEVQEEAGVIVKAERLLAVYDKNKHNHPPDYHHIYKLFTHPLRL